jgi:glutamine---fructose-6-phosphate transaminase (isomerizing)
MCGIIGYIGKENATPLLLEGLRRESYRGYDSSGIVVFEKETARYVRTVGKLEKLEEVIAQDPFSGTAGLGHNRWATHGGVTQENAHPHTDCKDNFFLVHNGIIENYALLREKLEQKGHRFTSQTDTEVLPHLIEHFFKGNLEQAVREALRRVRGAYGIAVIAKQDPGKIVVAKLSSPLVLSVNGAGGFVASDPAALLSHSNKMVFLDDREIGVITPDSFSVTDLQEHLKVKETTELDWTLEEAEKGGYPHFLLKEIMEQPESLSNALRGRLLADEGMVKLGGLDLAKERLREIERVQLLACGSASYASRVGEYMLEEYAGIPTEVDIASEFRYRKAVFDKKTLSIFVSQSGETADTLAALHEVKEKGGLSLGVVNVVGSAIARSVDMGIYTHAGAETAVASTKAFTAQIAALALIAVFLGRQRQLSLVMGQRIVKELARVPDLVRKTLEGARQIQQIAEKYQQFSNFFLIGRKYNNPIALEGALKLKEIAYVHAEGTGGGELKHGSLALIDKSIPTIAIIPSDSVYEKMMSGIQEIRARNGQVIAIATEGNEDIAKVADDVIYIPKTLEMLTPILTTIPMQLLAYYMGVAKGNDVDKPRNLAKSVTVE